MAQEELSSFTRLQSTIDTIFNQIRRQGPGSILRQDIVFTTTRRSKVQEHQVCRALVQPRLSFHGHDPSSLRSLFIVRPGGGELLYKTTVMLVDVVPTRKAGRRLKGRELGVSFRGDLVVHRGRRMGSAANGDCLCAYLRPATDGPGLDSLASLADVRILGLDENTIRLIGVELISEPSADGSPEREVERMQIWRCSLVMPHAAFATFDVALLREGGRQLETTERRPPVIGTLVVRAGEGPLSSFRREGLTASLRRRHGANATWVGAALPIFDVQLLGIRGDTLTIIGIELAAVRDEQRSEWLTTESVQVWRCTLKPDGPLERSVPESRSEPAFRGRENLDAELDAR